MDATGREARFYYIFDLAQIPDQKIWIVSELTSNCLRKIDAETLDVSTFSGDCDAQTATEKRVGALSETKWSLPGLLTYLPGEKKLYVSSDGGLRVIDMETEQVSVVVEAVNTIYDMIPTASNTLLLLHNSVIDELNPSDASNPVTRWRKEDVEDPSFSFVFDATKVDDDRLIIVDDTQGIWLLNLGNIHKEKRYPQLQDFS